MTCQIKLDPGAYMPESAHDTDAGYDLRTPTAFTLRPFESKVIDTGVHFFIPRGYAGVLKSKSGLNVNYSVWGTGLIDAHYTGSIKVKLTMEQNAEPKDFREGDKIIQIVVIPVEKPELELVGTLPRTERGDNGFGSTGR